MVINLLAKELVAVYAMVDYGFDYYYYRYRNRMLRIIFISRDLKVAVFVQRPGYEMVHKPWYTGE